MTEEYTTLLANNTWGLIFRPNGVNVVTGKWVYHHKLHPDDSLNRYKARWVLRGFTQQPGVDFGETFNPAVKPATICTILSIGLSHDWLIHQLDVKNTFLHNTLIEVVYSEQPSGFTNSTNPDHVCRLNKSLYGLKQASCARSLCLSYSISWFCWRLFRHFTLHLSACLEYGISDQLLRQIIAALTVEFSMKDMGPLHHFLGMFVTRHNGGLFLSQ
jgi:hypothetical protein